MADERPVRLLSRSVPFSGRWLNVVQMHIEAGGKREYWETVERVEQSQSQQSDDQLYGVYAMAFLTDNDGDGGAPRIIAIKQYRPAVDAYVIEWPGGRVEGGETPQETAVRELKEETGYDAEPMGGDWARCAETGSVLRSACTLVALKAVPHAGSSDSKEPPPSQADEIAHVKEVLPLRADHTLRERLCELAARHQCYVMSELYSFAVGLEAVRLIQGSA